MIDNLEQLTTREYTILKMIAKGLSNKEITDIMHASERLVKYVITSIFTKMGVKSRTEALSLAVRMRLLKFQDFKV